jgi:uncharacterized glyoxalase superfamily protein PhnB
VSVQCKQLHRRQPLQHQSRACVDSGTGHPSCSWNRAFRSKPGEPTMTSPTSAAGVTPVPPARGAIPYLIVRGAGDAIAYYQRAFGAEIVMRLDAPDGSVMHCELKVGPAHFMLSEERPQYKSLSPLSLGGSATTAVLYVPDADAVFDRALKAGATTTMPMADQFWGDRSGSLTDPFGHQWFVSTRKEDPSPAEMKLRLQEMFKDAKPC